MARIALGIAGTMLLAALPAQAVSINFQPGGNKLVSFVRQVDPGNPASGSGFVASSKVKIFENFDGGLPRGKAYTAAPITGADTANNRRGMSLVAPMVAFTGPAATSTVTANVYATAAGETGTGEGARPFAAAATAAGTPLSTGNFASVRRVDGVTGRYAVSFSDYGFVKPVQVFSFALGSVDAFNTVTLYFVNGTSRVFAGTALTGGTLTADQADARTNGRVTFDTRGTRGGMTGVVFNSTGNAFEFDDMAAATPEPGTWAMMILGFGFAGYGLRRARRLAAA